MRSDREASIRRLERLSRLPDYDVNRDQPDPRGWTVVNSDGQAIGEVKDLIVDTERMRATYLDVELDTKRFDLRDDPHVLVPMERAQTSGRRVVVDGITSDWIADLRVHREAHQYEFWHRWWNRGDGQDIETARRTVSAREVDEKDVQVPRRERDTDTRVARRDASPALNHVIDDVRPGETVRIPVVNEEIVIERRPIPRDEAVREAVVNRATDEPPRSRR